MEKKICKYCKEEIDKKAKRCPKCGGKFGIPTFVKVLIIVGIILFGIVACVGSCSKSVVDSVDELSNSYADINGKTTFNLNETFQNKYEKITMIELDVNFKDYSEYFEPADGKKYVMAKFEVENIDDENDELYISSLDFSAYADDISVDYAYIGNDKYNDLSATIGKGKKAIGYIFYEVPMDAKKVTIEYNGDFWTEGNQIEFVIE